MAALVITAGTLFGARIPLTEDSSVGRLGTSTVQLPSTQISREHGRLFRRGEGWWVEDMGSRNGTRINGEPVTQATELISGDLLHFGEISALFDVDASLEPARYGEAWVLMANPELEVDPFLAPVGQFGGLPGDLAGLSHLIAATIEEEGLVRGILQLVHDRLGALEVVLLRLGAGGLQMTPLGVVAPSGPVPVNRGLVDHVFERGRCAALPRVSRTVLKAGSLERNNLGGPAMCAPLRSEGGVVGALYVAREAGAEVFGADEVGRVAALANFFSPALENARRARLQRRRHRSWAESEKSEGLLSGTSLPSTALLEAVRNAAAADTSVLLTGERGTGKERIARLIHTWSGRWEGPLVHVPCSTLSESQLELLVFGRSGTGKGQSSAARLARAVVGQASLADGGSLYLDQVDALPPAVQDRLLRLLQSGHVWRLKATRARAADVRVMASSEQSLTELASSGLLRDDLLALLQGCVIQVPRLVDRLDDLEVVVEELVARISVRQGRTIRQVTAEAFDALRRRDWTGNLRELEGVLTRAISFGNDEVLTAEDVVFGGDPALGGFNGSGRLSDTLRDAERGLVARAMSLAGGDAIQAAKMLGMERAVFQRRLRELSLENPA